MIYARRRIDEREIEIINLNTNYENDFRNEWPERPQELRDQTKRTLIPNSGFQRSLHASLQKTFPFVEAFVASIVRVFGFLQKGNKNVLSSCFL